MSRIPEQDPLQRGQMQTARNIPDTNGPLILAEEQANPLLRQNLAERLKEKREPSLGERNPLLFPPDLNNPEAVEALTLATRRLIEGFGGIQPDLRIAYVVTNQYTGELAPRFVARFDSDTLTEEQLVLMEAAVKQTYGTAARTRTNENGGTVKVSQYPELVNKESKGKKDTRSPQEAGRLLGWYMGPTPDTVSTTHEGVFVHRDLGKKAMADYVRGYSYKEWFFKPELKDPITEKAVKTKYQVEVREGSNYQTDIITQIVQLSAILTHGKPIEHRELIYQTYNELNRLGLKKADRESIYGLDETIERIERVLFLPLANLELSSSIDARAGSVLLVGVPGTGKTLIAEHFLSQDTGVMVVPVDPLLLAKDMAEPPHKKTLLPRISQVFNDTGIPIVLHMDDIENIAEQETQINSTLLNLMAGVRESGFYVLASTNYPERLSPQLLQPQRFGHLMYFDLPMPQARYGILDVHATRISKELGLPLFADAAERDIILQGLSEHTDGYTSRFLAEIATQAKYYLIARVRNERKRKVGLKEDDLSGVTFTKEDWAQAYGDVASMFDKRGTVNRNRELRDFVRRHGQGEIGFVKSNGTNGSEIVLATFGRLANQATDASQ